ncbi:MAG TPA: proprotein convertase P-domain-containing protein [Dokdonella sp.]|nr:proprotein convertase P-domain-containing protein [Dokdonella sp.]
MKLSCLWTGLLLLASAGPAFAVPTPCVASGGTNCPARIGDAPQDSLVSTVNVPAVACPGSQPVLSVAVQLTHGDVGDLTISLQNPAGDSATLLSNLQGASGACRGGDVSAVFTDGGAAPICAALIPSVSGTISPSSPLAPLLASSPEGAWTLTVVDAANNGDGALLDWSIDVGCAPPPAAGPLPAPMSWQAFAAIFALLALAAFGALRRQRSPR